MLAVEEEEEEEGPGEVEALLTLTLTVCDMCRGAMMLVKMAPAKFEPLRLACCKSQPVMSQFCGEIHTLSQLTNSCITQWSTLRYKGQCVY